jgi:hypothetical protein
MQILAAHADESGVTAPVSARVARMLAACYTRGAESYGAL